MREWLGLGKFALLMEDSYSSNKGLKLQYFNSTGRIENSISIADLRIGSEYTLYFDDNYTGSIFILQNTLDIFKPNPVVTTSPGADVLHYVANFNDIANIYHLENGLHITIIPHTTSVTSNVFLNIIGSAEGYKPIWIRTIDGIAKLPDSNDNTDFLQANVPALLTYDTSDGGKWIVENPKTTRIYGSRLRLKNNTTYGCRLNFGDGDHVHLLEPSDDKLEIKADKINLLVRDLNTAKSVTISTVSDTSGSQSNMNDSNSIDVIAALKKVVVPSVTSDPTSPVVGEMWLRTDLL